MSYFRPVVTKAAGHRPSPYLSPDAPILKLNSNENPYPPSPQALDTLRTLDGEWLRRYPDPYAQEFCTVAAAALDVPADWIIPGNGCDDLLNLLIRACAGPGRPVVYPAPTYGLYATLAQICGAQSVEILYDAAYPLPIDRLVDAHGALTVIASPNSPFGYQSSLAELGELAARVSGLLVIDEAYVDFAEGSALGLVQQYDHVMVLRTLSKGYSLAGLRFGFGIAQPALLAQIWKVKDSYGVDAIAIQVAAAAMADQPYKNKCVARIKLGRQQLADALRQLGFQVYPSHGNFVLAAHAQAQRLHDDLRRNRVWVRHFDQPGLRDKLRITVGTPEQNIQLLTRLEELL